MARAGTASAEDEEGNVMGRIAAGVGLAGLLVAVVVGLGTFGWVNIHPTEVGVQVNKVAGTIAPQPLGVGYHFFNRWITDVVTYTVSARSDRCSLPMCSSLARPGSKGP